MRRRTWLITALLLLVAAGLLLSSLDAPAPPPRPAVEFPRGPRAEERRRLEDRETLAWSPPAGRAAAGAQAPPVRRDPFLVSLPLQPGDPLLVFEANALRHSRLGELVVACALARNPGVFADVQRELGVDMLKDLDRVAVVGDSVVVSGFFERARWDQLQSGAGASVEPYGDAGRIYRDGHGGVMGAWGNQLVMIGPDVATVQRSIDQLEQRAEPPQGGLEEGQAYGEVYGVIPGSAVRRFFPAGDAELGQRLAAAAEQIELHVDAMRDVAAVVEVDGREAGPLGDLARSLGGALAAWRVQAKMAGDQELAQLLDAARVQPHAGAFTLEVAVPVATLERWFERCEGTRGAPGLPPGEAAGGPGRATAPRRRRRARRRPPCRAP